ncbi:AraC family transcriptional regulator [Vibrio sp. UCD-FRSSP16_10]|uniref:helix-turn-helix domain-containing protein n=1 Tax=unclassified Vibrio TaxID=2614977 RepID=UPI0007FFA82C|nr:MULTISPECIES: AraC family transcriptional regulator [unclassified Vibrio]OBT12091.1 AraC family transcriptional regulator [Vibrio sp. UCD-FRSSP16_30]OBT20422.1 AraC family transcriptional regulator [Vibrio sp. UCD-FRSSP16_10]
MIHWLQSPKSTLVAKYVACYWLIEKTPDSTTYQYPKLNPDPCAHLIISPNNQSYHYNFNSNIATGKGSHWLFPHKQTLQLDHTDPFIHIGIKFKTGALYCLPDFSDDPLSLDRVVPINGTLLYKQLGLEESRLIETARSDPEKCCKQLDELLLPWLKNAIEDQHSKLTSKALQYIDITSVSELGDKLYCSQRTLERSFSRVTGLTLKQCQSMNRLEQMLEYVYQRDSAELDWVDIAFKFGFSDQPHLIRYLKQQLGFTPKIYEKERGLTIDAYGGVSSNANS